MKSTRPKLIPTLVCFAVIALFAAILPHPAFKQRTSSLNNDFVENSARR